MSDNNATPTVDNKPQERSMRRHPLMSDTDINTILVNGATISLAKLKRAQTFNGRLYYFAEIGVYLEVSLSRSSGISHETVEALAEIHKDATRVHMEAHKTSALQDAESQY